MAKNKKFAMILSGCGGMDGSETHEAVGLMIAIKKHCCDYSCFAIDGDQKYVISTYKKTIKQQPNKRNMLEESGRLNHGNVNDLKKLDASNFDGLVLPGGYGTGTSLSNFIKCDGDVCQKNVDYSVREEISRVIQSFNNANKPIFAGCMAPVLLNGSLSGIKIMIDEGFYTKAIIEKHNNIYQVCKINEICVDEENKIITAPFYMAKNANVLTVFNESDIGISEMIKMCF